MTTHQALDINFLKEKCQRLYFFGLGFIQVKINEEYRVHFYTDRWQQTATEEEIHNHRYSFTSTILKGSLTHEVYELTSGGLLWKIADNCSPGSMANAIVETGFNAKKIYAATYTAGSSYSIDSETFHKVTPINNVVTLLHRGPVLKDKADILYPRNTELTCPFSVKVSDEELWAEIERILND